jgi:hypothetical protein
MMSQRTCVEEPLHARREIGTAADAAGSVSLEERRGSGLMASCSKEG